MRVRRSRQASAAITLAMLIPMSLASQRRCKAGESQDDSQMSLGRTHAKTPHSNTQLAQLGTVFSIVNRIHTPCSPV